jgi:pimeloyl-ACP methyl ester carboxylesterase
VPTLLRSLLVLAGVTGGLLLLAFFGQRRLLYFPSRLPLADAERAAARAGLEPWRDAGGRHLGWRAPHPSGRAVARLVLLHGNAGSALDRAHYLAVLQAPGVPPLDLFLLEYPGYGARDGAPGEAAIVAAAVEGVDLLAAGDGRPVLLAGESLGSAVAALAAAERPAVVGLFLVTPLQGVAAVARRHYPLAPAFLLRDRLDAVAALARYRGPVAFLVAGADEVTFTDLGIAMHAGYAGPKRCWVQEGRGHNSLRFDPADPTWRTAVEGLLAGGW